jgi:ribonuclease P protein component
MLPASHRLETSDFPAATLGRRVSFSAGTLVFKAGSESFQAAVIVSKKVSKKSVVRNRIRRRVYAALYESLSKLPNGTCAVFPTADAATCSFTELVGSLRSAILNGK